MNISNRKLAKFIISTVLISPAYVYAQTVSQACVQAEAATTKVETDISNLIQTLKKDLFSTLPSNDVLYAPLVAAREAEAFACGS